MRILLLRELSGVSWDTYAPGQDHMTAKAYGLTPNTRSSQGSIRGILRKAAFCRGYLCPATASKSVHPPLLQGSNPYYLPLNERITAGCSRGSHNGSGNTIIIHTATIIVIVLAIASVPTKTRITRDVATSDPLL